MRKLNSLSPPSTPPPVRLTGLTALTPLAAPLLAFLLALLFAFLFAGTASADFSRGSDYQGPHENIYEKRAAWLQARQLIRTGHLADYHKLKPSLRNYALYPYLEYIEYAYRASRKTEEEMLAFAERYRDAPFLEDIFRHWLTYLAKRGQWSTFLEHYHRVTPTRELACQYGMALHKAGRKRAMMRTASDLWVVGFSQPNECDALFKVWRDNKGLTHELAWRRYFLASQSNRPKLAAYLMRFLSSSDRQHALNLRLVRSKPATVARTRSFSEDDPKNREIILEGVRRISRTDPEKATGILLGWVTQQNFKRKTLEAAWLQLGTLLALNTDNAGLLDALPVELADHPSLTEAKLRQSLRLGNWRQVPSLIQLLPESTQATPRWQYWLARVMAGSGSQAEWRQANAIFERLMVRRNFYGFMSADLQAKEYNFERDARLQIPMEEMLAMERMPGIERALELITLGERSWARQEWTLATRHFNLAERHVAANIALRWGWYKAAIQTMIEGQAWNNLDLRFPIAYGEQFINQARRANIPVQWSLAVARQESAFMPDAKSTSGALGLMQLLPSTAKIVAKGLGMKYSDNSALKEPDLNIQLGTQYLGQMLRRFDNNRVLASAAYNAGPTRVAQWPKGNLALDVWIETIPYRETRNYVQNVLMYSRIYGEQMDEPGPLIYPHERRAFQEDELLLALRDRVGERLEKPIAQLEEAEEAKKDDRKKRRRIFQRRRAPSEPSPQGE